MGRFMRTKLLGCAILFSVLSSAVSIKKEDLKTKYSADDSFRICCEHDRVTGTCVAADVCSYEAAKRPMNFLPIFGFQTCKYNKDTDKIIKCAGGKMNHKECCEEAGVPKDCMGFCETHNEDHLPHPQTKTNDIRELLSAVIKSEVVKTCLGSDNKRSEVYDKILRCFENEVKRRATLVCCRERVDDKSDDSIYRVCRDENGEEVTRKYIGSRARHINAKYNCIDGNRNPLLAKKKSKRSSGRGGRPARGIPHKSSTSPGGNREKNRDGSVGVLDQLMVDLEELA